MVQCTKSAMEKLQTAIEFFDTKLDQLEILINEERDKGRQAHARSASKHLIVGHVRCMKALEAQHTNVINMKTNLMERLIAEESSLIVKTYTDAMGQSLKHKGVNMNQLQKTLDSAVDRMDEAAEVSDLVAEPLSTEDLNDEIEALFGAGDNVAVPTAAKKTVTFDAASLPPAPTAAPMSAEERALGDALKNL